MSTSTTPSPWWPDISLRNASVIGEYFIDSSVASVGFSAETLRRSMQCFRELPQKERETVDALVERVGLYAQGSSVESTSGSLDELLAYLTYEHESEHHRISATTPFGLAVWRAFQALRTDVDFLFKRETPQVFAAFEQSTAMRARAFEKAIHGQTDGAAITYADQVCWECIVLKRYLLALLNDRTISKGAFVDLANVAEVIVARRSGVATNRRITVDPSSRDEPLVPDNALTPLEIMEATATLHEEAMLLSKRVSQATMTAWRETSLHGIYERAHSYFRTHFGFTRFGKIVGDLSFCGCADISTAPHSEVDLADHFPSIILERIRAHCAKRVLPFAIIDSQTPGIPLDDEIFGGRIRTSLGRLAEGELWNDNFISARTATALDDGAGIDMAKFLREEKQYSDDKQHLIRRAARQRLESFGRHVHAPVSASTFGPQAIVVDDAILFPDFTAMLGLQEAESPTAMPPSDAVEGRSNSFAGKLMADYAANCAVKHAVFDMPAPEVVVADPAHYPKGDARWLAATTFRSFFPPP